MASTNDSVTTREHIEVTAEAFLSAFEEGGALNDPSIINHDVTAECKWHLLPASIYQTDLWSAGRLRFRHKTFQETYAKDLKVLKVKKNVISNLVVDIEARRASFTSFVEVHPNGGESYSAEQAWVLYFTEDGSKVNKVIESCDKDVVLKMNSYKRYINEVTTIKRSIY